MLLQAVAALLLQAVAAGSAAILPAQTSRC
jgi:hypothetical protein